MKRCSSGISVIVAMGLSFSATAAEVEGDYASLFADQRLLPVTLAVDISDVNARKRQSKAREEKGSFFYTDDEGDVQELNVAVRPRGNYRRTKCKNPPLRLNFKRKQLEGTLFAGQDKLKLVRPCNNTAAAEQWVVLEYLAYRFYQHLTPESFAVRPLMVKYGDHPPAGKGEGRFGFVIESDDAMAERNGAQLQSPRRVRRSALNPQAMLRMELFQYMIGNNDYSALQALKGRACCHNMRLLSVDPNDGLTPVPYDFDFAGLVDASYASPPDRYPIKSVRTRYFRGFCQSEATWQSVLVLFRSHKADLLDLVASVPRLKERTRRDTLRYLEDFFETLDDTKRTQRNLRDRCR